VFGASTKQYTYFIIIGFGGLSCAFCFFTHSFKLLFQLLDALCQPALYSIQRLDFLPQNFLLTVTAEVLLQLCPKNIITDENIYIGETDRIT
jgi:hypothetical protein